MKANHRERENAIAGCSGTYWIAEVAATAEVEDAIPAEVEDAAAGSSSDRGASASMMTVRVLMSDIVLDTTEVATNTID